MGLAPVVARGSAVAPLGRRFKGAGAATASVEDVLRELGRTNVFVAAMSEMVAE